MRLHTVLYGFVNTGLDDYIVKSVAKTEEEILVHGKYKDYYRHQQVNAEEEEKSNKNHSKGQPDGEHKHNKGSKRKPEHNKKKSKKKKNVHPHPSDPNKTIPANISDSLKKEVIPGVCLVELIGVHEDDKYLAEKFPEFHELYTDTLMGKQTGAGQTITLMDFTHFPQRIEERGYLMVKDESEYKKYFKGKDPEKAIKRLPNEIQNQIRGLTDKQKQEVATHVQDTLLKPAFTLKGSSDTTPQGSTVYVSRECCVVVLNLPDDKGVVKTFYPTRKSYKKAMDKGWDGSIPLEEFQENLKKKRS